MTTCDHIIGLSTAPGYEGCLRQSSLTAGDLGKETRALFTYMRTVLKPDVPIRPCENPEMPDAEIVQRYVRPFSYCPDCGEKLPPITDEMAMEGRAWTES